MKRLLWIVGVPIFLAACGAPGGLYGSAPATSPAASSPAASASATPTPAATIAATPTPASVVPERGGRIVCSSSACTTYWPPSLSAGGNPTGSAGVTGQLGLVMRAGGAQQVTYSTWPLYTFAGDSGAGQTSGQGVVAFGGKWLVATPRAPALKEKRMKKSIPVVATLAAIVLGTAATSTALASSASTATADRNSKISGAFVIAMNQELLKIVQTPGTQPATVHQTRSYAMLHAAINDAIVSITHDASPLLVSIKAPRGARPDAAAIEAGRATLTALYPGFSGELAQLADAQLATIPNGADKQHGIQVGDATAEKIVQLRANDGSAVVPPPFTPGTQPGNYRPTPPNFPTPVFTNWGHVTPFVLKSGSQFRSEPPPALTSPAYARALNEVKSLGQNTSTARTADQTVIGKFWAPPIWNTWNVIAENEAIAHHTNLERTARLFALLNLSFADSTVAMYDGKYHYQLWRPITAIRLADTDGNPATVGDPNWSPLAVTAADPSYPGAHSTISAAGATVLAAVFGNRDRIQVTSSALPGIVRTFNSYSDVATEAGLSRIFAGQHFRFDHVEGLELGHDVAQFVLHHSNQED